MSETKAPLHLRPATRSWYARVASDFDLEPHHHYLLAMAAKAWDRAEAARVVLDKQGLTYTDRFGAPRVRPEVAIERDARLAFARLLRELDLDADAPGETRLPGLRSNRR